MSEFETKTAVIKEGDILEVVDEVSIPVVTEYVVFEGHEKTGTRWKLEEPVKLQEGIKFRVIDLNPGIYLPVKDRRYMHTNYEKSNIRYILCSLEGDLERIFIAVPIIKNTLPKELKRVK